MSTLVSRSHPFAQGEQPTGGWQSEQTLVRIRSVTYNVFLRGRDEPALLFAETSSMAKVIIPACLRGLGQFALMRGV